MLSKSPLNHGAGRAFQAKTCELGAPGELDVRCPEAKRFVPAAELLDDIGPDRAVTARWIRQKAVSIVQRGDGRRPQPAPLQLAIESVVPFRSADYVG